MYVCRCYGAVRVGWECLSLEILEYVSTARLERQMARGDGGDV
jgi:hypothetical protein